MERERKKCDRCKGWYTKECFIEASKSRLYREQLVDTLLEFLKPFEDFEGAKPCNQVLDIEIAVFLDSFIDRIEMTDKNETNLFLALLNKPSVEYMSIQDELLPQNEDDTIIEFPFQDNTEELYSLLENVKASIDENIQTPNAEKWINFMIRRSCEHRLT
ncbi:24222_t:CDS:2 [Gigaspora margarita]|uniref:24222_t:CDS:1 n=1 Tax=Gigaspora margarita TaxID=4874 RepID=A0ABN7UV17_GIGMA|nr:24222_t:CDS:2 [Gigaspora margarita]